MSEHPSSAAAGWECICNGRDEDCCSDRRFGQSVTSIVITEPVTSEPRVSQVYACKPCAVLTGRPPGGPVVWDSLRNCHVEHRCSDGRVGVPDDELGYCVEPDRLRAAAPAAFYRLSYLVCPAHLPSPCPDLPKNTRPLPVPDMAWFAMLDAVRT